MASYRCYFLVQELRFAAVETFDCCDDEEARRAALALTESRQYRRSEVWDRHRLVARVERVPSS